MDSLSYMPITISNISIEIFKESVAFWKRFNWFFVLPAMICVSIYSIPRELEHQKHLKEHQKEFVGYAHLRKRKTKYPFYDGDHTLFWNPRSNPDPQ